LKRLTTTARHRRQPLNLTDPSKHLAAALGRIPSGLFVVTARQGPVETGMLASWVQQCSFDPPQITLALKPERDLARWLTPGAGFTINILDDTQTDMIAHFGKGFKADEAAFAGLEIEHHDDAGPVLQEALAFLACQVVARQSAGDHDLIIGRVLRGRLLADGQPMVHVRKSGLHY
jgi:flavin reductase (DIM6/NTAB) family NADH-FMN oxidoreductase RutF